MVILHEGLVAASLYVPLSLAFSVGAAPQAAFNVTSASVAMVGAYVCVALVKSGLGSFATLILAAMITFLSAAGLHFAVMRPLLWRSGPERSVLLASLGIMALTEALLALAFGSELVTLRLSSPFEPIAALLNRESTSWITATGLVVSLVGVTFLVTRHTRGGRLFRATCDNRRAAIFYRLPVEWVDILSSGAAAVIAWIGIMVVLLTQALTPSMVLSITLWSVTGAILGGMRSPLAACAGGVVLGFLESGAARALPHQMLDLFVGGVFVLVLVLRPSGLFLRRRRAA